MASIVGSGIPGSSWRSHQTKDVTTSGFTFVVDGLHEVYRVSFQDTDGALTTVTVTITAGNQVIFGTAVGVPTICTPSNMSGVAFATGAVAVWEPLIPLPFSANWPIQFVPSTELRITLQGREVSPQ